MRWVNQSLQQSIIFSTVLLSMGCSSMSHEQQPLGIPEIQGVWRHSAGKLPHAEPSLTFEFQRDQFRVSGPPDIYARGQYTFQIKSSGAYKLVLMPEVSRNLEVSSLQIQTTGDRILFIDQKMYRRILRH